MQNFCLLAKGRVFHKAPRGAQRLLMNVASVRKRLSGTATTLPNGSNVIEEVYELSHIRSLQCSANGRRRRTGTMPGQRQCCSRGFHGHRRPTSRKTTPKVASPNAQAKMEDSKMVSYGFEPQLLGAPAYSTTNRDGCMTLVDEAQLSYTSKEPRLGGTRLPKKVH